MPGQIETLGEQIGAGAGVSAASDLLGMGMGLLMEGHNDRRQLQQQGKLQDLQMQGQRQMMDYGYQKQMQMWNDTNYAAQVGQLNKAGLNPGLLYAKGGPGGVTGTPTGNVQGATAQQNPGEVQAYAGMGIQSQMAAAQMDLMKAQADKTRAEIPNVPKTGQLIDAQTTNTQQATALAKVNTQLATIQAVINGETKEETIDKIIQESRLAQQTADQAEISLFKDRATQHTIVDMIKAQSIGAIIQNSLMQTEQQLKKEEITQIGQNILQKWQGLKLEGQQVNIQQAELILDQEMQKYNLTPSWKKTINSIIGGITNVTHTAGTMVSAAIK